MTETEIRPFRIEISDAVIDDLRERLARTRWPESEPVDDWSMGAPLAYVRQLAGYWAQSYEMQRVADQLNRYEQFTTTIDGVDIHFLRVRSPVEGATPCIMTHGWPGSVMAEQGRSTPREAALNRWASARSPAELPNGAAITPKSASASRRSIVSSRSAVAWPAT